MLVYAARRVALTVPLLLGMSVLIFALMRVVPGDPATLVLGFKATPEQLAREHMVFIRQAEEIQRCRDTLADHVPQPTELACDKRFFRGFPEPGWSASLNAALADAVHTRPDLSDTANAELEQIPGDEQWLREHRKSLGARPVRVITAAQHKPETIAAQAALLAVSSNARQIIAAHSRNAYMQFDEPQLVLDAIAEAAGRKAPNP